MDRRAFAAGGHQAGAAQDAELLAEVGRLDADQRLELAHRALAVDEQLQGPHPRRVAEGFEQVGLHLGQGTILHQLII